MNSMKPINDDKVFGGDREEKIDIDEPVGKEPAEGEEKPVDGPGGSDHGDELIWRVKTTVQIPAPIPQKKK